jgi:hypothetical protein
MSDPAPKIVLPPRPKEAPCIVRSYPDMPPRSSIPFYPPPEPYIPGPWQKSSCLADTQPHSSPPIPSSTPLQRKKEKEIKTSFPYEKVSADGLSDPKSNVGGKSKKSNASNDMAGGNPIVPGKEATLPRKKSVVREGKKSVGGEKSTTPATNTHDAFWIHVGAALSKCKYPLPVYQQKPIGYCKWLSESKYPGAINILLQEEKIPEIAVALITTGRWETCPMESASAIVDDLVSFGIYRGPHIIIKQVTPCTMDNQYIFFHPTENFTKKMKADTAKD